MSAGIRFKMHAMHCMDLKGRDRQFTTNQALQALRAREMQKVVNRMKIKKCSRCPGDFEPKGKELLCPDCNQQGINWDEDKQVFNVFKGKMFGKSYKLNKMDKKIIRTRARLFKIQRKEMMTDERSRV